MLTANGIDFEPDALAAILPEIFGMAEYRGGLCELGPDASAH